MKPKINKIYNECEDRNSTDIRRLIGELEDLLEDKEGEELEETLGSMDRF